MLKRKKNIKRSWSLEIIKKNRGVEVILYQLTNYDYNVHTHEHEFNMHKRRNKTKIMVYIIYILMELTFSLNLSHKKIVYIRHIFIFKNSTNCLGLFLL